MKLQHHPICLLLAAILTAAIATTAVAQHQESRHHDRFLHLCGPALSGSGLNPGETGAVDRFNYPWRPGKHLVRAQQERSGLQADDCGGFRVDFEDVIKGNAKGFDDRTPVVHPLLGATTRGQIRRHTVCEVFRYIADVIEIRGAPDIIIQESETDGTGFLAAASPFFVGGSSAFVGGTFYDHITLGVDPTAAPGAYDARVIFDFGFPYHDDWSSLPGNAIDLYSVTLHEITHALGIFSLIGPAGNSIIGSTFSLFDRRMLNGGGVPMVNPATGDFNGDIAGITSNALLFEGELCGSPNPIYSPAPYRPGSSLSHFDPYRSGIRYVMSPSTGGGDDRRYTVEEIQVLCDLGYRLRGRSCARCAPRAVDDYATTLRETEVCVDVLVNDVSHDGSPLTIDPASVRILAGGGSVRIDGNRLCYTPPPGFIGLARLVYAPHNGDAIGSEGRLLVNVTEKRGGADISRRRDRQIWYFGAQAGLSFAEGSPVPLTDGELRSTEAASTMCDRRTGALLFYTNGTTVWDATHAVMQGGDKLLTHESSTQAGLIVPHPGDSAAYYLFTASTPEVREGQPRYYGLRYSMIDMRANGGRGAVVQRDILLQEMASEKLTAVPHGNGHDYWVITRRWGTDLVDAFLVSCDGITGPVSTATGGKPYHMTSDTSYSFRSTIGYIKASPDGRRLVSANTFVWVPGQDFTASSIELFDFDNLTGRISNRITLASDYSEYYGVSFSPDSRKLYASGWIRGRGIVQFDLSSDDSVSIVRSMQRIPVPSGSSLGSLQLGPDGKIYVAIGGSPTLGVINRPNERAPDCEYQHEGIHLAGRISQLGLCNLIEPDLNRLIQDTARLRITKTVNDDTPRYGDTIAYTIMVCNLNSCGAVDATVEDVLPDGLDYVDGMSRYPSHDLVALLPGECRSVVLRAVVGTRVPLETPVVNCADVETDTPLSDLVDRAENCAIITVRGTDLSIVKVVNKARAEGGEQLVYSVLVTNYGPVDATNVVVHDMLPPTLRYDSYTVDGPGTYDAVTGELHIPSLPVGTTFVLRISCTIVQGGATIIVNCAELARLDQSDLDLTNNAACVTTERLCSAPEITVRGGIERDHIATLSGVETIPVLLYEPLDGNNIDRIRIGVEFDSTIMVLTNGNQFSDLTDGTLLDGWRVLDVRSGRGRYQIELEAASANQYLTGTGPLLNLRFKMYLGGVIGSELPTSIELPNTKCVAVDAESGYVRIDSVCGLTLRLIELIDATYAIKDVHPNPTGSQAVFDFSIGLDAHTRLEIFDGRGDRVAMLVDGPLRPGHYIIHWDAIRYPSGVYYYRMTSGDWSAGGQVVVVK